MNPLDNINNLLSEIHRNKHMKEKQELPTTLSGKRSEDNKSSNPSDTTDYITTVYKFYTIIVDRKSMNDKLPSNNSTDNIMPEQLNS